MIDIESQVFTKVKTALTAAFPNINVGSVEDLNPSAFPYVSIVEIRNSTVTRTQDSSHSENHVLVTYEINIFSNKRNGRKSECKAIAVTVDAAMQEIGFTRIMSVPISFDEATRYRYLMRYQGVASRNGVIYRR